jgi:replicative DNA helicase
VTVVELARPTADHAAPPPNDVDAEAAVIACALLTDRVVEPVRVEEGLTAERFYRDRHRLIWQAVEQLADQGDTIDVLTVTGALRDTGRLDDAGGAAAIDAVCAAAPTVSGARSYARRVVDAWRRRTQLHAHYRAITAIHERDEAGHAAALAEASGVVAQRHADPTPKAAAQRFAAYLTEPKLPPLPLPWATLSRRFRMRGGQTTVLASWTHWGKSWVALELAAHAGQHGHPAVIWTNEMSEPEIIARQVQRATAITSDDVLDAQASGADPAKIVAAARALSFGVQECFGWPVDELARHIRHVAPALAIVDHFHQLPGISRHEIAEHAVQTLTSAAHQCGCHLVLVSQLNTARDTTAQRPQPTLRDLRSTGALQSLPNNVVFLQREQDRDPDSGETWLSDRGTLHVAKQRGGRSDIYQRVLLSPPRMRVIEEYVA